MHYFSQILAFSFDGQTLPKLNFYPKLEINFGDLHRQRKWKIRSTLHFNLMICPCGCTENDFGIFAFITSCSRTVKFYFFRISFKTESCKRGRREVKSTELGHDVVKTLFFNILDTLDGIKCSKNELLDVKVILSGNLPIHFKPN